MRMHQMRCTKWNNQTGWPSFWWISKCSNIDARSNRYKCHWECRKCLQNLKINEFAQVILLFVAREIALYCHENDVDCHQFFANPTFTHDKRKMPRKTKNECKDSDESPYIGIWCKSTGRRLHIHLQRFKWTTSWMFIRLFAKWDHWVNIESNHTPRRSTPFVGMYY